MRTLVIALLCGLSGLSGHPAAADNLTLLTEEYPPYNMSGKDGAVGLSTEIVRELMKATGTEYSIAVYPWARAIALARTQVNTCVFSMSRTPEREPLYKWVGPLVANEWTLFAKRPASRPESIEATMHTRIGSYQGDAIVTWLQTRGHTVEIAPNDDVNPRKLMLDRIDFWATGRLIGQFRLRQQGLDQAIEPVLTFNRTEMYLACQRGMPDESIARMNRELEGLIKRGVVRKIYSDHGYAP